MSGAVTATEIATLRALARALGDGDASSIEGAAKEAYEMAPLSVRHGEIGTVLDGLRLYARRRRIVGDARVRQAESHAAQLLEQRDEALARRDELEQQRVAATTALAAVRGAIGEAWVRAADGDLAEAVRMKTASLEAAMGRSLDVQALEGDVLESARELIGYVMAGARSMHDLDGGCIARAGRDDCALANPLTGACWYDGSVRLVETAPAPAECPLRAGPVILTRRGGAMGDLVSAYHEARARLDAYGEGEPADEPEPSCRECDGTGVVEEVHDAGLSHCDPGDVREIPCPECSAPDEEGE